MEKILISVYLNPQKGPPSVDITLNAESRNVAKVTEKVL